MPAARGTLAALITLAALVSLVALVARESRGLLEVVGFVERVQVVEGGQGDRGDARKVVAERLAARIVLQAEQREGGLGGDDKEARQRGASVDTSSVSQSSSQSSRSGTEYELEKGPLP